MSTRTLQKRKTNESLEYVLEDYLEVKASLSPGQSVPLKKFLLAEPPQGSSVLGLEGFRLDEQLVLIDHCDPHQFKNLVFLTPGDGKIRVRALS